MANPGPNESPPFESGRHGEGERGHLQRRPDDMATRMGRDASAVARPAIALCVTCGEPLKAELPAGSTVCRRCQFAVTQTVHPHSQDESTGGGAPVHSAPSEAVGELSTRPNVSNPHLSMRAFEVTEFGSELTTSEPKKIDRFEVLELLGKGGFARVYRALDPRTGRIVALKTPRRERFDSDQEFRRYLVDFLEEGMRAQKLTHPHIVGIYECGLTADGNTAYIAMEWVEGGSLAQRLASEPKLTRKEIAAIVRRTADALHYAHNQGIVHRDIKPANILLTKSGVPKIADFGLAVREDDQLVLDGEFAGTGLFMPPEQLDRRVSHMDGRADIWSLGVVLYLMLSGRHPFAARDQPGIEAAIRTKPFRPVSQRDPTIPPIFDEVLSHCLAKRIEDRYQTAGELCSALKRYERRGSIGQALKWGAGMLALGTAGAASAALAGLFGPSRPAVKGPIEQTYGVGKWINLPADPPRQIQPGTSGPHFKELPGRELVITSRDLVLVTLGDTLSSSWELETDIEVRAGEGTRAGLFFGMRRYETTRRLSLIYHRLVIASHRDQKTHRWNWTWKREIRSLDSGIEEGDWTPRDVDDSFAFDDSKADPVLSTAKDPFVRCRMRITAKPGQVTSVQFALGNGDLKTYSAQWPKDAERNPCNGMFGITTVFLNDQEIAVFRDTKIKI